jgi:hypothetical protein
LNALRSLAFAPNKYTFAIEGGNLVYEGLTSVPDVSGTPANKNYIIRKIQRGEGTVKSIKDTLGKELDGEFQLDDPDGTRLMTAEEDMMNFLYNFANSSFADVIDEMKEEFDVFVKLITARNEQVVLYNMQLRTYLSKFDSKNKYEEKAEDLRGQVVEVNDSDLPNITAYMGDIYQSSRARVMQFLDNLLRFRMLTNYDIFHLGFEGTRPEEAPLTITSNVVLSARSRVQDRFIICHDTRSTSHI